MPDFGNVSPGDSRKPYRSASWLNAVSQSAAAYHGQAAGGTVGAKTPSQQAGGNHVKVKNVSGSGLLRGHCVQLGDYTLTTLDHRAIWFECDAPADPITSRIAIMRVATPDAKFGEAQMQGITTALVNVTDIDHTHAAPVDGEVVMESGTSGLAEILSPLTETGEQEIVVRLGGGSASVLYGETTAAVAATDATFSIDTIRLIQGTDPRTDPESATETLLVNNTLNLKCGVNEPILAIRNVDGEWDTWGDTDTGGDGCEIVHFTLTADLDLSATTAAATVIDSTGSTTGSITVTDSEAKFAALIGYKGYAVQIDTAWEILELEGPARFADAHATASSTRADDTITCTLDYLWGNPPNGKDPASLTSVTVYKLPDHDLTIYNGDKLRAIWNEDRGRWELFWYSGLRLTVKGTVYYAAVGITSSTFQIENISLVNGWRLPGTSPLTVTNDPPLSAAVGETIYARFNITRNASPDSCWDTGDSGNIHKWVETVCMATCTSAVASTDASFSLEVSDIYDTLQGVKPAGTAITVYNDFNWDIDADGIIKIEFSRDTFKWYVTQAECPA